MKHFSLNYQNAHDHQTFQDGDMLQGALTHIYIYIYIYIYMHDIGRSGLVGSRDK